MYSAAKMHSIARYVWLSILTSQSIMLSAHLITNISRPRMDERFTNCLIAYIKAKWVAQELKIPYHYTPFILSNELLLHEKEKRLQRYTGRKLAIKSFQWLTRDLKKHGKYTPTLYKISYGMPIPSPTKNFSKQSWPNDHILNIRSLIDGKNSLPTSRRWLTAAQAQRLFKREKISAFITDLKKLIQPKNTKIPTLAIQADDTITIAVHIRTGEGYDNLSQWHSMSPERYPFLDFYARWIKFIVNRFPNKKISAHIFTDDPSPHKVSQNLQALLAIPTIQLTYSPGNRAAGHSVIEDFFAMQQFDCLIRGASGFGAVAELLGDFKLAISAESASLKDGKIAVTTTIVRTYDGLPMIHQEVFNG